LNKIESFQRPLNNDSVLKALQYSCNAFSFIALVEFSLRISIFVYWLTILFVIAQDKTLAEFCSKITKYEQSTIYTDWLIDNEPFTASTGTMDFEIGISFKTRHDTGV